MNELRLQSIPVLAQGIQHGLWAGRGKGGFRVTPAEVFLTGYQEVSGDEDGNPCALLVHDIEWKG